MNGLGQAAAVATLGDLAHYRRNFDCVKATRARLTEELGALGFDVFPSQTNFLLAVPPGPPAREWLERLRECRILVRWFSAPGIDRFLRITVGTDSEADALLRAVRKILRSSEAGRSGRNGHA